jgi:hypothetical protein
MADPRYGVLTVRNIEKISERLLLDRKEIKNRKLRMDVFFASQLLFTLLETGVIDGPVSLVCGPVDKPKRRRRPAPRRSGGGRRHG